MNNSGVKFRIQDSLIPQQNGSYEVTPRGGYRRTPDGGIEKPNIVHFVNWLTSEGRGTLYGQDNSRIYLTPENRDTILTYLGFSHFINVEFAGSPVGD